MVQYSNCVIVLVRCCRQVSHVFGLKMSSIASSSDSDSEFEGSRVRPSLQCTYGSCTESFRKQRFLDRHLFRHTGIRTHKCKVVSCDKAYTCKQHLKRHIQTAHDFQEKEIAKCPDCPKTYQSQWALTKHQKAVHIDPKYHQCPHCPERFLKKNQLRLHIIKHTGKHKCPDCDESLPNIRELAHHRAHKHAPTEPKRCRDCDQVFDKWTLLIAHRKSVHTSKFPCPECNRIFYSKCKLKIHQVSHTDQQLSCSIEDCQHVSKNKRLLVEHIRRRHADKRFKCDICGLGFTTKASVERHQGNIHNPNKETVQGPVKSKNDKKRKRKDAGQPKVSTATVLAGVETDPVVEKILLAGEGRRLQIQYTASACAMDSASATDTESEATRQGSYAF